MSEKLNLSRNGKQMIEQADKMSDDELVKMLADVEGIQGIPKQTDTATETEPEESEEPTTSSEVFVTEADTEETYEVIPDAEMKNRQVKKSAQERIRQLANGNRELKEKLEELERKLEEQAKAKEAAQVQTPKQQTVVPKIDERELEMKIFNKDPKVVMQGLKELIAGSAKELFVEGTEDIRTVIDKLAVSHKARTDNISEAEIEAVYKKHPALRTTPGGYEIAKELVTKKNQPRAKEATISSKPATTTNNKKRVTKSESEMQKIIYDALHGKS